METTIIVSQEVRSFAIWQEAFFEGAGMRADAGINVIGAYQDVNNENRVTVISEAPSAEVAEAFIYNPEMKVLWEKIGIIGEVEVKVLKKAF